MGVKIETEIIYLRIYSENGDNELTKAVSLSPMPSFLVIHYFYLLLHCGLKTLLFMAGRNCFPILSMAFKMDKAFNEGDSVIFEGQDSVIVSI